MVACTADYAVRTTSVTHSPDPRTGSGLNRVDSQATNVAFLESLQRSPSRKRFHRKVNPRVVSSKKLLGNAEEVTSEIPKAVPTERTSSGILSRTFSSRKGKKQTDVLPMVDHRRASECLDA